MKRILAVPTLALAFALSTTPALANPGLGGFTWSGIFSPIALLLPAVQSAREAPRP